MRYNDIVNIKDTNKSHTRIINLIPEGSTVLDVGCSTGFLGEYLIKEKKCTVEGIEFGCEASAFASKRLNAFTRGDVEDPRLWASFNGKKYGVIVAGDILEHLKDPGGLLKRLKDYLDSNGRIIISLPNIAHFRIRIGLLLGRFEYTERGIMDSTHLRFYTYDSARRLIEASGYLLAYEDYTLGPRIGDNKVLRSFLPRRLFACQFIFVIMPDV